MNETRIASMPHFAIAFDLETHLIQPGLVAPPIVLGAVDTKAYVDLIYSEIEGLLQRPCPNMAIGKKA